MNLSSYLIFIVILGAKSRLVFDHVEKNENEKYIQSSVSIDNSGDISYLNWNVTMKRRLHLKTTIKTDIYIMPNTRQSILPIPRLNYCDLSLHSGTVPFLIDIYAMISQYAGEGLTRCPTALGFYPMKNINIGNHTFAGLNAIRLKAKYMLQLQLLDENGKKPVQVYKYKIFVRYE